MKNIARDAAAELEPMRKLEQEFMKQLSDKDEVIRVKDGVIAKKM
jgi:chromosome segregation ATPase